MAFLLGTTYGALGTAATVAGTAVAAREAGKALAPKSPSGPNPAQLEQAAKAKLVAIRSRRSGTRFTGSGGLSGSAPTRKTLLGQ